MEAKKTEKLHRYTRQVGIRVTPKEYQHIASAAKRHRLTVSEYLRMVLTYIAENKMNFDLEVTVK